MIALGPIIALIIQLAPTVITLLSQLLPLLGGPNVPVVTDHPVIASFISGLFLPHPVTKKSA